MDTVSKLGSLRGLIGPLIFVGLVLSACEGPSSPYERSVRSAHSELDSSAQACLQMDCRSLTDGEQAEMEAITQRGMNNAANDGNGECLLLYQRSADKLAARQVYVANNQAIPGMTGAWNWYEPNEIYIHVSRFGVSPAATMNTLNHEADHDRVGRKPENMDRETWEGERQSAANNCQSYAEY